MDNDETTALVKKDCPDPRRFCLYENDRSSLMRELRLTRDAVNTLNTTVAVLVSTLPENLGERLATAETQIKITKGLGFSALVAGLGAVIHLIINKVLGAP